MAYNSNLQYSRGAVTLDLSYHLITAQLLSLLDAHNLGLRFDPTLCLYGYSGKNIRRERDGSGGGHIAKS
jgi:hypothetical protein